MNLNYRELLHRAPPFYTAPAQPDLQALLRAHAPFPTQTHRCHTALLSVGCFPPKKPSHTPSTAFPKQELPDRISSLSQQNVKRIVANWKTAKQFHLRGHMLKFSLLNNQLAVDI